MMGFVFQSEHLMCFLLAPAVPADPKVVLMALQKDHL